MFQNVTDNNNNFSGQQIEIKFFEKNCFFIMKCRYLFKIHETNLKYDDSKKSVSCLKFMYNKEKTHDLFRAFQLKVCLSRIIFTPRKKEKSCLKIF